MLHLTAGLSAGGAALEGGLFSRLVECLARSGGGRIHTSLNMALASWPLLHLAAGPSAGGMALEAELFSRLVECLVVEWKRPQLIKHGPCQLAAAPPCGWRSAGGAALEAGLFSRLVGCLARSGGGRGHNSSNMALASWPLLHLAAGGPLVGRRWRLSFFQVLLSAWPGLVVEEATTHQTWPLPVGRCSTLRLGVRWWGGAGG